MQDEANKEYDRGYTEGVNMFLKDGEAYKAFEETVPKHTNFHKGLVTGKENAQRLMIEKEHAEKTESNFKYAFNVGYHLQKGDEISYNKFMESLKHLDNSAYKGYESGGKQAKMEEKVNKILSKPKDKSKEKDVDFD